MIEAKICSNGNEKKIETRVVGSRRDICLEMAYLIRSLYEGLLKSSPSEAEYFRWYLIMAMNDNLFWKIPMGNGNGCCIDLSNVRKGGPT